ncbi:type IV secretory system conjugative DNA transfer family protein [Methylibium petroleiphilum]|uniref:Type IV secretory pathway, VirD4 component n=1 Tax=Methylibium petroleiphilum (strain ATCC BAA-1232 / LMG 22953 / PM1) TaxID=420662 RepID=A2SGF0_METPP|nr:type IV secretory system conjugative DNA transfer family protein [Methylibium petroleiphilum]ABM94639.1 type IV secretory pathway, VirD4 component [Methylibium petroleiphilum PM1]
MSSVAALPFSAWPTGRKVAAGAFAVMGYIALACAAVYLAGVLFLVLNKANPKQAQFASIVHYWGLYADDAQLRKKLQLAIGVSGIGLLILLPAGLVAAARPRRALHGDARFASPAEVDRAGLTGGDGQPGILIGRHRGKFLSLPGQLSVMLSAPTRSGKGVGVVIPNLLNWPDSVVVLDIKGENYDITAGYRAAHGQAVYAFSPFDEDARSQRDADEYSAMLGHFTERATSRGHSRSFSGHGHSTVSRNESEQRRALLLPQEFKELGSERLVVIFENCKPILGEKIRYYRDKAFTSRLRPAPAVPRMNMDLHLARVQERWRYVDDELGPGDGLDYEQLAYDMSRLPALADGEPGQVAEGILDFMVGPRPGGASNGGAIEAVADEDDVLLSEDSTVVIADPSVIERADIT